MVDKTTQDYEWVLKVLDSCKTENQLKCAHKCFDLWEIKHRIKTHDRKNHINYFLVNKFLSKYVVKLNELSGSHNL